MNHAVHTFAMLDLQVLDVSGLSLDTTSKLIHGSSNYSSSTAIHPFGSNSILLDTGSPNGF
jgi:hypothetical protein